MRSRSHGSKKEEEDDDAEAEEDGVDVDEEAQEEEEDVTADRRARGVESPGETITAVCVACLSARGAVWELFLLWNLFSKLESALRATAYNEWL